MEKIAKYCSFALLEKYLAPQVQQYILHIQAKLSWNRFDPYRFRRYRVEDVLEAQMIVADEYRSRFRQ